jgi:hypothetical protein
MQGAIAGFGRVERKQQFLTLASQRGRESLFVPVQPGRERLLL